MIRLAISSCALIVVAALCPFGQTVRCATHHHDGALAGSYRYVGGESEIADLDAAIEGVVQQMTLIVRGIARKRLRESNLPTPELKISFNQQLVEVSRPGRTPVQTPLDGTSQSVRIGDSTYAVRQEIDGHVLVQTIDGRDSHTVNRFELGKNGALRVHTQISSKHLPSPVVFAFSYRRAKQ
jgi:hypothetical protein